MRYQQRAVRGGATATDVIVTSMAGSKLWAERRSDRHEARTHRTDATPELWGNHRGDPVGPAAGAAAPRGHTQSHAGRCHQGVHVAQRRPTPRGELTGSSRSPVHGRSADRCLEASGSRQTVCCGLFGCSRCTAVATGHAMSCQHLRLTKPRPAAHTSLAQHGPATRPPPL